MKSGRFFWGSFLIGLGILMLLQRTSTYALDWHILWKFWPLVLVFWGGAVLARGTRLSPVSAGFAGLTLAAILGAFIQAGLDFDSMSTEHIGQVEEFVQPFDSTIRRGSFRLGSGAGSFTIEGTGEQLVAANVRTDFGHYVMRCDRVENSEDVSLSLEGENKSWSFSRSANRARMRFNPSIPWDMEFNVGASQLDLDLSLYRVEHLTIHAGASEVRVRLGDLSDETRLTVKSGVSSVRILVPRSSASEITVNSPLSGKNFRDFSKTESGLYRTENFSTAKKRVHLVLESGVSNLTVVRY